MPKPVGQVTISVLSAKSVAGAATSLDPCAYPCTLEAGEVFPETFILLFISATE